MRVGHHYPQANTNNVNKTWALLQTTGGKERTNHRLYAEITTRNPNVKTHNRRTQNTKKMSNTDLNDR